jgi:hypothetical protein
MTWSPRRWQRRRIRRLLATTVVAFLLIPTTSAAAPTPHWRDRLGTHERHLAALTARGAAAQLVRARSDHFKLLGHHELAGPTNGDVWFYDHGGKVGKYAYVGTWSDPCSGIGVKIVDVNDPTHPRLVATTPTWPGVSHEDVVVRRIGGRDILGAGIQICGEGGVGGLALFDVTNPRRPTRLSFLPTPSGGVHELDLVVRPGGRALALLAVPFAEFDNVYFGADNGGDFRIVDITDPAQPVPLADWGVIADSHLRNFAGNDEVSSPFQGLGYFAAIYAHSARAADRGRTAYVSYWDSGILKFDIRNPRHPRLLARTAYGVRDDGDGHSMTPYEVHGRRYILQNDEDFERLSPTLVTSSATGGKRYAGIEEPWMPTLLSQTGTVAGRVHDAGDGCQASDFVGAAGKVVLVDTVDPFYVDILSGWSVPCALGDQVLRAARAGARALLLNLISPDDAYPYPPSEQALQEIAQVAEGMPAVMISDIDELADRIRAALANGAVRVRLRPGRPSFGFLRVYSERGAADRNHDGVPEYRQVGRFAGLPHVTGELFPPDGGWSIHNTEVLGDRAYSSWYSHGIVALDVGHPTQPAKVGQFVPPPPAGGEPPFALVWGVAIDPDTGIIYASDINSGLWIVRPTGRARPGTKDP